MIRKWTPGAGKESDSMEHHTDWVNDFVLCDNGEVLISASSDQDRVSIYKINLNPFRH